VAFFLLALLLEGGKGMRARHPKVASVANIGNEGPLNAKAEFARGSRRDRASDGRYDRDAYYFVREASTSPLRSEERFARHEKQHVSGQELLDGLRFCRSMNRADGKMVLSIGA